MKYPPQGPPQPGGRPDPSQHRPTGDQSQWSRPGEVPPAPDAGATERIQRPAPGSEQPTEQLRTPDRAMPEIVAPGRPGPAGDAPSTGSPSGTADAKPALGARLRSLLKDPLSVVLVLVIVLALGLAGLIGGELYARHRANTIIAGVVQCIVQDAASASFGLTPPFLWQHATKHYTNISIETDGNNVRDAKDMTLQISIKDVRLAETADSAGTIGSLVTTVDWTTAGIKETLQGVLPLVGGIISSVTTNPHDGTITVDAGLGTIVAQPRVDNGGVTLEVLSLTGLGFMLPRETIQPVLDSATDRLTRDYPMGIHAESVTVTEDGVQSVFVTRNASIPKGNDDPCFAGL